MSAAIVVERSTGRDSDLTCHPAVVELFIRQLQAESRRLEELERGIGILQEAGVVVPRPARSSIRANDLGRSNDISFTRQYEEVSAAINSDADIWSPNSTNGAAAHGKDGGHLLDGDDADKPLCHVDGTAITPDNSSADGCVSSLVLLKNGEISKAPSREGKESAVVSLLRLIHENATKMQVDSQPFYRYEPLFSPS